MKEGVNMKNYELISKDLKMLWKENFNITKEKYTQSIFKKIKYKIKKLWQKF